MGAAEIVVAVLQLGASLLDGIGKVAAGKRVREILTDEFPTFPDRAAAAGEAAKAALDDTADKSALDDRATPSEE
jgi:hypothetical protein